MAGAKKLGKSTKPLAIQDHIRVRQSGLRAFKSVLSSGTLAVDSSRELLGTIIPAILSNLRDARVEHLNHLVHLSKRNEDAEKAKAMNRRQSIAAVRTISGLNQGSNEADPRSAAGTY